MTSSDTNRSLNILFVYSQDDEKVYNELTMHLAGIRRRGFVKDWLIQKIETGTEWKQTNASSLLLEQADLILLLISPDFIESGYSESKEVQNIFERKKRFVLPILFYPSNWKNTPLAQFTALPSEEKPVSNWEDRDKAFYEIAREIHVAIEECQYIQTLTQQIQVVLQRTAELEEKLKNLRYHILEYPQEYMLKQCEEVLIEIKAGMLNSTQRLDQLPL